MSTATPSTQDSGNTETIAPGTLVGGRFEIERHVREDAIGATLLARDQKTRKPIAIRVLSNALAGDPATFETIRGEIKAAAKLKHRSLVGTYGVGTHAGSDHFVACEWVQGAPMSQFVTKRKESNSPLSVRGVYNVVAHVCKALGKVHGETCHGALRPSIVWITKSGRVKVGDLGLGRSMVSTGKWTLLSDEEQAFLAPEVKAGGAPDFRSDVFGVGALMYVLLTGRSPTEEFIAPSQAHPDATPELDAILMKCLAGDPAARYEDLAQISTDLMPLVASTPEPEADEFGVDVEIDIDVAMSIAPPAPSPDAPPPVTFENARASGVTPAANPLAAAPIAPPAPPEPDRPSTEQELAATLDTLSENDAPRWMAVKDGLDHGPFTVRELVKLIVEGEVLPDHGLLNMDTNERKPVLEWAEFAEFIEQYKLRKAEADHESALEKSTKIERRGNVAKFAIFGAAIAVFGIAGGSYLMSRGAEEAREAEGDVDLAAMFESGQVKITGTAGILKAPTRRKGGGGGKASGKSTGGGGGGFASYEDAMNTAMELGDVSRGGGERQLTSNDVAGVMNRKLNTLFGCVSKELRRGGRLGTVKINLAILGSGKVMGASVNTGSPAFKRCIVGKVRGVKFPSFPAPRMGARYSFDVN
ncbi:MAG: protein kinase [Myxococcales bacterium]|nr:protein kinase [Myxococcales bacterium]